MRHVVDVPIQGLVVLALLAEVVVDVLRFHDLHPMAKDAVEVLAGSAAAHALARLAFVLGKH